MRQPPTQLNRAPTRLPNERFPLDFTHHPAQSTVQPSAPYDRLHPNAPFGRRRVLFHRRIYFGRQRTSIPEITLTAEPASTQNLSQAKKLRPRRDSLYPANLFHSEASSAQKLLPHTGWFYATTSFHLKSSSALEHPSTTETSLTPESISTQKPLLTRNPWAGLFQSQNLVRPQNPLSSWSTSFAPIPNMSLTLPITLRPPRKTT
jgi:hypothetical protein